MYTLRRQGFFNWIVARAGGYSCGSELLIHLECTNFAIPWTASVAVKTPSMTRFCSKLSFLRSCLRITMWSSTTRPHQSFAKSWCPSIMSIILALHSSPSKDSTLAGMAFPRKLWCWVCILYKPNKLDRLHLQCFAYTIGRHSIWDRFV